MRILQLIKSRHFAGSEQYLLTLGTLLRDAGHEVHVACVPGGRMEAATAQRGLPRVPVNLALPLARQRLVRWCRAQRIELLHTHLTGAARIGEGVARQLALPLVAHLHVYRLHPVFGRIAGGDRGCLVAVSRHIADTFREGLALSASQVRVVLNASAVGDLPEAQLAPQALKRQLGEELGVDPAQPWVLMPGRLSRGKGQDVLFDAVRRCRDERVAPFTVLVAGVGKSGSSVEQELRRQVASLGLTDRVRFLGFRSDVPRLLRAADVVVVPSRFDVLPLVVLETLMMGTCLLASATGGIPEVVKDGVHGRLVPPDDPAALAAALADLVTQEALRARLAADGQAHARRHLSPDAMRDSVEAIYRELCGSPAHRRRNAD